MQDAVEACGSAATLAAATAQSIGRGSATRDADPFAAPPMNGAIVIAGSSEPPPRRK